MKPDDAPGADQDQQQQDGGAVAAPGKTTKVLGVEFPCGADDVLASREYPDRVVVVTRDGQKLAAAKPKKAAK